MFRHVVMFRWNDDVTEEIKAEIGAELDRLAGLDSVAAYAHGPDAGVSDGNWEYAIVGDFNSVEDYQAYATEAGHLEMIANLVRPNISARAAVQYEH